ncbi:hypothetical protein A3E49_01080 [Candidatus Saccharibacteria bacterium RIFCSPHIGHO2_12_FULL_49_19]|nr:MAG: hypothetical protein A3E49_01080 [Candidatus Saccharibacteria bacterium RIFCSPHIGHO2_12_FULL_49_19]OGL38405.1 MAG: hypothetical protein A3B63_03400 [Candidatus Saccharibacteria bacterium RIFCSPLOWO2_01_FULL_49_22]
MPRRALKADDLTVTCAVIDGQRVLRIFRPRGAVLTTRCLLTLRLAYDASAICDPEGETQVVNRTHTRSLFELLRVPVRDDIPDMVAEATAERTADEAFALWKQEVRNSQRHEDAPHRVYAATRNAGLAGVRA